MVENVEALLPLGLAFVAAQPDDYAELKETLRTWAKNDPIDTLMLTAFAGGIAFWLVERGRNSTVQNVWDGILYIATSFSVGYDTTFPATPAGHAIATFVHSFGPAMAAQAFDPTAAETAAKEAAEAAMAREAADTNKAILARLEDIVRLLEARPAV